MTRTLLLCTVLLTACDALFGQVTDRRPCATHADCPAGLFCAPTSAGGTCWEDPVPPAVTGVTVRCGAGACLRDGALVVEAWAADDHALAGVSVALDLDGGARRVDLTPLGGGRFGATLDLADWPLSGLSATVTATVTAVDGARNRTPVTAPQGQRPLVTRVRPPVTLDPAAVLVPTAPALAADGTVVVGGSTGRLYLLAPGAAAATSPAVSLGRAIVHPPVLGRSAIWVAAGNWLFAVAPDGSAVLNGAGYDTGGAVAGPAAITAAVPTASAPEVAFIGSAGGRLAAVKAEAAVNGLVNFTRVIEPFSTSAILVDDSTLFAVSTLASPPTATVRKFSYDGGIGEGFSKATAQFVSLTPAATSGGGLWSGSSDFAASVLSEATNTGASGASISLGASATGSPIVLSNGDVSICAGDKAYRFTAAGAAAWAAPASLDGAGLTPIALAAPGGAKVLLVPTRSGAVHALRAEDGALLWSVSLSVNELREGTVGADPTARTSTAWFTSADGLLHGLIVDGALDASAPWPKAWHDGRNTGNLAAQR